MKTEYSSLENLNVNNSLNKVYATKCNWWCRRFQDVKDLAVGYATGGIFGLASEIGNLFRVDLSYFENINFTSLEEKYLDAWYYLYFEPYFIALNENYENQLKSNTISVSLINKILLEIQSIQNFYKDTNNDKNLSKQAAEARLQLVNDVANAALLQFKKLAIKTGLYQTRKVYKDSVLLKGLTSSISKIYVEEIILNKSDVFNDIIDISSPVDDYIHPIDPLEELENINEDKTTNKNLFIYLIGGVLLTKILSKSK